MFKQKYNVEKLCYRVLYLPNNSEYINPMPLKACAKNRFLFLFPALNYSLFIHIPQ